MRAFFFVLCSVVLTGCVPSLKSIEKNLDKTAFTKAKIQFLKREIKIPIDPGAAYLEARFFADSANADFKIDSAYVRIRHAQVQLQTVDEKQQKELKKLFWDEEVFHRFQRRIERDAFLFFLEINNEEGYQEFRDRFPEALETEKARERQHQLAFATAQRENTYTAFQKFFQKYPEAEQAEEAEAQYEILLFQTKTQDNSLSSYEKFLAQYPETPYRKQVEERIYELFVRDAEIKTYEDFIRKYPENQFVGDAWQWLWWLTPEKGDFLRYYPNAPEKSRFEATSQALKNRVFAFGAGEKLGFLTQTGKEIYAAEFFNTSEDLLCEGSLGNEWLPVYSEEGKQGAVSLLGEKLLDAKYDSVLEVGSATLKTCLNGSCALVLKNGTVISEGEYDDLQSLASGFIAFKKRDRWGVITQNNRLILEAKYDAITDFDAEHLLLHQYEKTALVEKSALLKEEKEPALTFWRNSEWHVTHETFLARQKGMRWGVQRTDGYQVIDFVADRLEETPRGWAVQKDGYWSLYDFKGKQIFLANAEELLIDEQGFGVHVNGKWGAISPSYRTTIKPEYDSLVFIRGGGGLLFKGKQKFIFFQDQPAIEITKYKSFTIQFSDETEPYLVLESRAKRKGILDKSGKEVVPFNYEDITISNGYAVVTRYGKRGLIRLSDGKEVLKREYDGLVAEENSYFSLLKSRKFGIYHPEKDQFIAPLYEGLVQVLDTSGIFIVKDGGLGLIDKNRKTILPFDYEEIVFWSENTAWVKREEQWFLQTWSPTEKSLAGPFESVRFVTSEETTERLAFPYSAGKTQLWSDERGQIVASVYDDLWDIGMAEPFYWAERAVEDGTYQVDYLDKNGHVIFSQLLSEELYERMVCD
ncbi:MAG: WG repeat-containing protein [Bacteroidota bacterium]